MIKVGAIARRHMRRAQRSVVQNLERGMRPAPRQLMRHDPREAQGIGNGRRREQPRLGGACQQGQEMGPRPLAISQPPKWVGPK